MVQGCRRRRGDHSARWRIDHVQAGALLLRKIDRFVRRRDRVAAVHLLVAAQSAVAGWFWTSSRTDDEMHGRQERRLLRGFYGHYCSLPLSITRFSAFAMVVVAGFKTLSSFSRRVMNTGVALAQQIGHARAAEREGAIG